MPGTRAQLQTSATTDHYESLATTKLQDGEAGEVTSITLSPGRFSVIHEHARGGLGKVSLARDERLERSVAIKEIRPDRVGSAELRERFLNEARITGQLQHPGIVPIYALEEDAHGQPYYAMRFVEGQTLAEAIRVFHARRSTTAVNHHSIPFRELLQRFASVCQTVAYAHSQGVIHRDLKPANVMLGGFGETLVLNWGAGQAPGCGRTVCRRLSKKCAGGSSSSRYVPLLRAAHGSRTSFGDRPLHVA